MDWHEECDRDEGSWGEFDNFHPPLDSAVVHTGSLQPSMGAATAWDVNAPLPPCQQWGGTTTSTAAAACDVKATVMPPCHQSGGTMTSTAVAAWDVKAHDKGLSQTLTDLIRNRLPWGTHSSVTLSALGQKLPPGARRYIQVSLYEYGIVWPTLYESHQLATVASSTPGKGSIYYGITANVEFAV